MPQNFKIVSTPGSELHTFGQNVYKSCAAVSFRSNLKTIKRAYGLKRIFRINEKNYLSCIHSLYLINILRFIVIFALLKVFFANNIRASIRVIRYTNDDVVQIESINFA